MVLARILTAIVLVTVWTEAALQQPPRDGRPPLRSPEQALAEAHEHYKAQEWREAADRYEEALAARPGLVSAYFFLGNSYDNLCSMQRAGDPQNDACLQKAVQNYTAAAERETNPMVRKLALEYLVAAYGPDKLDDPSAAEPIVLRLLDLDPGVLTYHFELARLYERAGFYDEAEQALIKARDARPRDAAVYLELSGFYNRVGDFPKMMEALHQAAELEPHKPESHQRVAVFYWEKAFRDFRLSPADKRAYLEAGIAAADRAIALSPDYAEALVYKNILLRLLANDETDALIRAQLLAEADALRARAIELNGSREIRR